MPPTDVLVVLGIATGAMALFVTGKLRVDVTALCVLVALVITGQVRGGETLYGFASPATATVAAMFVLSGGLVRTGLVQWLARRVDRVAGTAETQLVLVLCVVVAALSTFIVNTATVAILIPVAIVLAEARKISPSRVLIPLSFASQFGGVCTLLGTSTNILVNSMAVNKGMDAGISAIAGRGTAREEMTPQQRQQAQAGKHGARRARQTMKMARRLGRM